MGLRLAAVALIISWCCANGMLSPKGVNFEVQALMHIRDSLKDPDHVLDHWDKDAVDPCSWAMVTCSSDSFVVGLGIPNQGLFGTLSPSIGNLSNLQILCYEAQDFLSKCPRFIRDHADVLNLFCSNSRRKVATRPTVAVA